MKRAWRWTKRVTLGLLGLAVLAVAFALIAVHTDWGRNIVRGQVENILADSFPGGAKIGRIDGSPFGTLVISDVVLNGPDKLPLVSVKRLEVQASIAPLLGKTVWDVQHKFRIVVGPLAWERFATLLPDGKSLAQLRALVRQYVGFEFAWDLRLILKRDEVPVWTLAGDRDRRVGRLGRTAWLQGGKSYRRSADADQLIMNVESIRLGSDLMPAAAAA